MKLTHRINAFIFGLTLLLASGCSKNDDSGTPEPVNSAQNTCQLTDEGAAGRYSHTYTYNNVGKVEQMFSPGGSRRDIIYNAAGNISEVKTFDTNNNLTELVTIAYNSNGLPESRLSRNTPVNGAGYIWQQKAYYNSANQLIKQTHHFDDTVTLRKIIHAYPAEDQVITKEFVPSANGGYRLEHTYHIYYDNMKSPDLLLGNILSESIYITKHNPVKIVLTKHSINTTETTAISYVYNAQGFPTKRMNDNHIWNYNCL